MLGNKTEELKKELAKYRDKLGQLEKEYAETRGGSRYGSEYLDIQVKVYTKMISDIEEEIRQKKFRN